MTREFWFDFSGNGFTVKDEISGEINKEEWLNVAAGYSPGKVQLNGVSKPDNKASCGKSRGEDRSRREKLQVTGHHGKKTWSPAP